MSQEIKTITVTRFDPDVDAEPRTQSYEIPVRPEWKVLDALNFIKDQVDATLSHRWSCRMAVCGSCGMNVDGKPTLTCKQALDAYGDEVEIEPLSNFPVIRDLVVELEGFLEKLQQVKPWILRAKELAVEAGPAKQTPAELEVFRNFHKFEYRDPNSFYKWLVTVIGWKIRDFDKYFFKTSKRQPGETLSLDDRIGGDSNSSMRDLADTIKGNTFTPSQIAVQREGYRMLEAALEKLPPHYREVLRLRHLEQRSARETAELLALKVSAVNLLFHRAQQRLHEVLREMAYFSE